MTDTSKFRPDVLKLFEPRPPLEHLEHTDVEPTQRRTPAITGIGAYLGKLKDYTQEVYPVQQFEETKQMKEQRLKREKLEKIREKLEADLAQWNPHEDPHIKGEPYKTVFVARLDYNTTEVELQKEFTKFGSIERVRIVRDKDTGKSKGYAFVVFERESGARAAYKEGNGMKLGDRTILTDVEKGRTAKTWIPRRLGGGVGGRHYTQRAKMREQAALKPKIESHHGPPPRTRGAPRFAPRGGRGDFHRSGFQSRDSRDSRESRDRYSYSSRGGHSNYDSSSSSTSTAKYTSRSERPSTGERSERPERTERYSYDSRNKRDDRDFRDRERDGNRDARMLSERDKERMRY